jgi:transposase
MQLARGEPGLVRLSERLRFVARLLEGEKMAPLCAEFGISRKTGYKIFDRYKAERVTRGRRQVRRRDPHHRLPTFAFADCHCDGL